MGKEGNFTKTCIFVCLCAQPRMMSEVVYISIDGVRLRQVSQIETGAAVA